MLVRFLILIIFFISNLSINPNQSVHFTKIKSSDSGVLLSSSIEKYYIDAIKDANVIGLAAFELSNKAIVDALKKRLENDAEVQIVIDYSKYSGETKKNVQALADLGATICVYIDLKGDPQRGPQEARYMHNKFLYTITSNGQTKVITGSPNITFSGLNKNAENIIIVRDNPEFLKSYSQQLKAIINSRRYKRSRSFILEPKEQLSPNPDKEAPIIVSSEIPKTKVPILKPKPLNPKPLGPNAKKFVPPSRPPMNPNAPEFQPGQPWRGPQNLN